MEYVTGSFGMGWLPDYPDHCRVDEEKISGKVGTSGQTDSVSKMIQDRRRC